MKRVSSSEFRDHAARYLAGDETLTIERRGEPLGVYIPVAASPARVPVRAPNYEERIAALDRFEQKLQEVLASNGLTEDEFFDLFDACALLPDVSDQGAEAQPVRPNVARG